MKRALLIVAMLAANARAATNFMTCKSGNINDGGTFCQTSPGVQGTNYPGNGDAMTVSIGTRATVPTGYGVSMTSVTLVAGAIASTTSLFLQAGSSLGVTAGGIQMGGGCLPSCSATSGYSSIYVLAGATLALGNSPGIIDDQSGSSINGLYFWGQSQSNPAYITGSTGTIRSGAQGGFNQRNTSWTYVSFNGLGNMTGGYCGTNASFQATSVTWVNSGEYVMPIARAGCVNRYTEYSDIRSQAQVSGGIAILISDSGSLPPSGKNYFSWNTVSTDTAGGLTNGMLFQINGPSVTVTNNIFKNYLANLATSGGLDMLVSSNVFFSQNGMSGCVPGSGGLQGSSTWSYNFSYAECSNAHFLQPGGTFTTVAYNIFQSNTQGPTNNQDGKIYLGAGAGSTAKIGGVVSNNIGIGTIESADLLDFLGAFGSTDSTNFTHNTIFYSSYSASNVLTGWTVGETYAGRNGMMTGSVSSNLLLFQTTQSAAHIQQDLNAGGGFAGTKIGTQNCNGFFNVGGSLYQSTAPANWYGANDVQAWPSFVDFTRNLLTWDTVVSGVGTSTDAINGLLQQNNYGGTYNPAYNLNSLRTYIQTGFTPMALPLAYHNTTAIGCDGLAMGAMPVLINHSFFGAGN